MKKNALILFVIIGICFSLVSCDKLDLDSIKSKVSGIADRTQKSELTEDDVDYIIDGVTDIALEVESAVNEELAEMAEDAESYYLEYEDEFEEFEVLEEVLEDDGLRFVPGVLNINQDFAEDMLVSNGFIPAIKYEHSDEVPKGYVVRTEPEVGSEAFADSIVTVYISDGPALVVPDLYGTDESSAKIILANNLLIPNVSYVYDIYAEKGKVVDTEPQAGTEVERNSKVVLYVSKGPYYTESKSSRITWYNVDDGSDWWSFKAPYIEDGKLYIQCYDVSFAANVAWRDLYNNGYIIGNVSLSENFDRMVPVSARYTKQSWSANERQSFTLEVPLGDLGVDKPTTLYVKLFADVYGISEDIRVNFTMSW